MLIIQKDKSIKDLIEKYLDRIGKDLEDLRNLKLIFNDKVIKYSDESVGKVFNNQSSPVIKVQNCDGGIGGGSPPFNFVDVTSNKKKLKKVLFDHGPLHRKVNKGLNIFGICKNKNCGVKGKEVIYRIKLKQEGLCFNVNEERENIKCPICNTRFMKKTCGFWRCEYQFVGSYYDYKEGKKIEYKSEPHETHEEEFEYFDPDENGTKEWDELFIFVLPKQAIKYKK